MIVAALLLVVLAAAGLCAGSFVTTAAIRGSRGEAFLRGRSHCDGCGAELSFVATAPIASYVRHAGVAPCCDQRIDPLHPMGELAGLAIVLAAAATGQFIAGAAVAALGFALLALTMVDLRIGRLPNILVALVAGLALVLTVLDGWSRVIEGMAATLIAFAVLTAVRQGFLRFLGRSGLGGGDVKLIAALALWLGWTTPLAVALASALGLLQVAVLRPKDGRIAFGPAIALAGFTFGLARLIWRFDL